MKLWKMYKTVVNQECAQTNLRECSIQLAYLGFFLESR